MAICKDEVKRGPWGHLRSAVSAISVCNGAGAALQGVVSKHMSLFYCHR